MLDARISESGFQIRRAIQADAGEILDCLAAAFEPYRASYTPAAYLDTVLSPEAISMRLAAMRLYVAMGARGQVVGTIACATNADGEGHLRGMALLPEFQGQGIAERLLQTAEDDLAKQGCSQITLDTTEPLERAMRFYERNGYRRSGKVTDFFGMPLHELVKGLS
jgi:ribosomal protein S18 acetylase RimI-like enzyme